MVKGIPRDEHFDWTERAIKKLRDLWALGLSTAEIGRQMGITKNAVIGKKNRLRLPGRASPIKPKDGTVPIRRRGPTLPALESVVAPVVVPVAALVAVEEAPPPPPRVLFQPRKATACCWPFGDPKAADFRFCDATAIPGRSYCAEHHAIAYLPARSLAEKSEAKIAAERAFAARGSTVRSQTALHITLSEGAE
jgi:GcrA cell cycle regulator